MLKTFIVIFLGKNMANLFSNPAVIGAVTGVVAYFLLEEVLDDYIEGFTDLLKGKKKGDGNRGGRNRNKDMQRKAQGLGGYTPPPSPMVPPSMNAYYTDSYYTGTWDSGGWYE